MATRISFEKNNLRKRLAAKYAAQRKALRAQVRDRDLAPEDRFKAVQKLSELPRNSAKVRIRNRCALTGRARGYHRKFGVSRLMLRELASQGQIPGVTKSSW
jgi:small subunit ribosomal protein S14